MAADNHRPGLVELYPDAVVAGDRLRALGRRVAVAESCTGGLLGAVLTAAPGASDYLVGGVIAYDNAVKVDLLGVDPGLLNAEGAVSASVAVAMARGVRQRLGADLGVGITGVAGPGGDAGKPAGLVFVGVADEDGDRVVRLDRDRGREGNRTAAVHAALEMLAQS